MTLREVLKSQELEDKEITFKIKSYSNFKTKFKNHIGNMNHYINKYGDYEVIKCYEDEHGEYIVEIE